ncbi:hypothetical protein TL16_g01309 [Triparma laevis f. inornata]|uniref:Charged multivesicular body protein 6 n=1 Tax=Triparma laevis f. inornata TaxID=1714386 RepID=A0A9W6ZEC8_9STRA|nr:hypothetical protein TL16_g01309 [Triparma laevis f. inornata]
MGPSQSKTNKKAPAGEVTSQDRAILDLKNSRDRLKRYIAVLDVDEKRLLDRAKEMHQQGKKRQAVLLMKVRKKKIKEAENVEAQLLNVYEMVSTIQWTSEQSKIMSALKTGKDALKQIHDEMSVDDVLNLMEEVEEEQEQERLIQEALTRGVSWATVDDEELERELEELQEGMKPVEEKPNYDVDKIPEGK